MSALADMYVRGVSTRKMKAITMELRGHEFSAGTISAINKTLEENLEQFTNRPKTLKERGLDFRDAGMIFDGRPVVHIPAIKANEARFVSVAMIGKYSLA